MGDIFESFIKCNLVFHYAETKYLALPKNTLSTIKLQGIFKLIKLEN